MSYSENDRQNLEPEEYKSLTPSVIQVQWRVPTEFPACPEAASENALQDYAMLLKFGGVFARNKYYKSLVVQSVLTDDALVVLTHLPDNPVKNWAVAHISISDGFFYHRSEFTFYTLQGALMQFCELTGDSYDDPMDNYC